MIIYDLVTKLLKTKPETRNSDKKLQVEVYRNLGAVKEVEWFGVTREAILLDSLLSGKMPSMESIRRSRQKAQELYPELEPTDKKVRAARHLKELTKGQFIYQELV